MTLIRVEGRTRRFAGILLPTATAIVLVSCSACAGTTSGRAVTTQTTAGSPGSPAPTTITPKPTLPVTADGTDGGLCADGDCEVGVAVSSVIQLPPEAGLGALTVTEIGAQSVTVTALPTQSSFSTDGEHCTSTSQLSSPNNPFTVHLTCPVGETTGLNKTVALEIVGVVGQEAVIRVRRL